MENAHPGTFILRVSAHTVTSLDTLWSIPDLSLREFAVDTATGDISVFSSLRRARAGRGGSALRTSKKSRWVYEFPVLARDKSSRKKVKTHRQQFPLTFHSRKTAPGPTPSPCKKNGLDLVQDLTIEVQQTTFPSLFSEMTRSSLSLNHSSIQ